MMILLFHSCVLPIRMTGLVVRKQFFDGIDHRFFPTREEHHRNSREALRRTYARLLDEGVDRLYYLDGEQLLGDDGEAATDGSHPNDLGMVRYADAYEPALRAALGQY